VRASKEAEADKVGTVTSVVRLQDKVFALAYLRCKKKGEQVELQGKQLYVDGEPCKVCALFVLLWPMRCCTFGV
jgi:deoxycytidylate deaminase